jgi:hypothetical protein
MSTFAPFDVATLSFDVAASWTVDPKTGNTIPVETTKSYTAAVKLSPASTTPEAGADQTVYSVTGKLLSPTYFGNEVRNGALCRMTVNGIEGRLELSDIGIGTPSTYRRWLKQDIQGTFRVVGLGSSANK